MFDKNCLTLKKILLFKLLKTREAGRMYLVKDRFFIKSADKISLSIFPVRLIIRIDITINSHFRSLRRMIAMMFSDDRKYTLSGWFQVHERKLYNRPYQLQIFLLLYEFISKIENDEWDLRHLFGLEKGPVYGAVWTDYGKICDRFHISSKYSYEKKVINVNENRAKRCAFIVQTLTEEEWSSFMKKLNIWKVKESEILNHKYNIADLDLVDLNDEDINLITMLYNRYSSELVENSKIISVKEKKFVVSKMDHEKIIQNHMERLEKLAKKPKLYNPVFVKLDDEGELVKDISTVIEQSTLDEVASSVLSHHLDAFKELKNAK